MTRPLQGKTRVALDALLRRHSWHSCNYYLRREKEEEEEEEVGEVNLHALY